MISCGYRIWDDSGWFPCALAKGHNGNHAPVIDQPPPWVEQPYRRIPGFDGINGFARHSHGYYWHQHDGGYDEHHSHAPGSAGAVVPMHAHIGAES